jgi:hypothetical protein
VGVDTWIPIDLRVTDAEGDPLELEFLAAAVNEQSPKPQPLPHRGALDVGVELRMPGATGVWILSALAVDDHRNMAVAQTSVALTTSVSPVGERAQSQSFPFYVYRDEGSPDHHFAPSGQMGDQAALVDVDYGWKDEPWQAGTSIRFQLRSGQGWYGMAWLDPPTDWGNDPGGFDLTGATTLSFLARGQEGGETVTFGFGLIGEEKKWFDTARAELKDVRLTRAWRRYSIPLAGRDLSRIKTGFALFAANRDGGVTFFVDDVKYE